MRHLILAASAALLAACAGTPEAPSAEAVSLAPANPAEASIAGPLTTGTRIPEKGRDRTVRAIGNQTYKNDDAANIRSIGNDIGARGN
jgi:hypothetical protein